MMKSRVPLQGLLACCAFAFCTHAKPGRLIIRWIVLRPRSTGRSMMYYKQDKVLAWKEGDPMHREALIQDTRMISDHPGMFHHYCSMTPY